MHAPNFAVAVAATAFFRMSLDALLPLGPLLATLSTPYPYMYVGSCGRTGAAGRAPCSD